MKSTGTRTGILFWQILLIFLLLAGASHAEDAGQQASSEQSRDSQVMHAFTQQDREEGDALAIPEREKHLILFVMGAALLVFLIVTAALGIAMAIYGKRVFVAHMIFAGFSVTLAIAHSVVAIVWFFPFSSP